MLWICMYIFQYICSQASFSKGHPCVKTSSRALFTSTLLFLINSRLLSRKSISLRMASSRCATVDVSMTLIEAAAALFLCSVVLAVGDAKFGALLVVVMSLLMLTRDKSGKCSNFP